MAYLNTARTLTDLYAVPGGPVTVAAGTLVSYARVINGAAWVAPFAPHDYYWLMLPCPLGQLRIVELANGQPGSMLQKLATETSINPIDNHSI